MEQKVIDFGEEVVIKTSFHKCKTLISITKVDIKKIKLYSKKPYSFKGAFKYFIGYINNIGIIPLYIKGPQMNTFVKCFDSNNKYMNLLVGYKE